jgi:hypothetical protein
MCLLSVMVPSCSKPTHENITEVKNGQYKVAIRSQEFHNSSDYNVDICVAELSADRFPTDKRQCFLHGFDFNGLSAKWKSEQDLEISFDCGRVSEFHNFAFLSEARTVPIEFHATLLESCGTKSAEKSK